MPKFCEKIKLLGKECFGMNFYEIIQLNFKGKKLLEIILQIFIVQKPNL